jgi:hypothetical protein
MAKNIIWKLGAVNFNVASLRYRCLLPSLELQKSGYSPKIFLGNELISLSWGDAAAIVFVKTFTGYDYYLATQAVEKGIPVYIDLCDDIFYWSHTLEDFSKDDPKIRQAEHFFLIADLAETIVVTGSALKDVLISKGISEDKIRIIHDGIEDLETVQEEKSLFQKTRKEMMPERILSKLVQAVLPIYEHSTTQTALLRFKHRLSIYRYKLLNTLKGQKPPPSKLPQVSIQTSNHKSSELIPSADHGIRVLWFGNAGVKDVYGMTDLLQIKNDLKDFFSVHKGELWVSSNNEQLFQDVQKELDFSCRYFPWSLEGCISLIKSSNLIVVPGAETRFSKCKSPNRSLLALHYGKPVVAEKTQAIEQIEELIYVGDWKQNLILAAKESAPKGSDSREDILKSHSKQFIARQWFQLLFS